jgi:dihydrofolate reductase
MAHLIYTANLSLDGYTEDKDGNFDWTDPEEEVFRFITNCIRADGTHLYGRRMYETMMVWETDPNLAGESPLMRDFAEVWQAATKLCTPGRWRLYPLARRKSSESSIQKLFDD